MPMKNDAFTIERRQRLRALQAPPVEHFDWPELLRFVRDLAVWTVATIAFGIAFAWAVGSGLDWLEGVAKAWAK
jgi:hypothetical protein